MGARASAAGASDNGTGAREPEKAAAPPPRMIVGRGGDPLTGGFAGLVQVVLVLAACGLIWNGIELSVVTESAIHQIYQLMMITSGLSLFAIVGVWAAIDALRRSLEP